MTITPNGRCPGRVTRFLNFGLPNHIFGIGRPRARHFKCRVLIDTEE